MYSFHFIVIIDIHFSGSVVSTGSRSQQQLHGSDHQLQSSGVLKKPSKLLHSSTIKLSPITETDSTSLAIKKCKDTFKVQ